MLFSHASFLVVFIPPAIVFFGSRWLSQIPVGPIYFYDLVLGIFGLLAILIGVLARSVFSIRKFLLSLILLVVPIVATVHLLISGFSFASLREFAPFLYLIYAWFVAILFPLIPLRLVNRGVILVGSSLGLHWLWVALSSLGAYEVLEQEIGPITLFSKRADIDTTLVGVFAAVMLLLAFRMGRTSRWRNFFLFGALVVLIEILLTGTRAGHLASVLAMASAVLYFAISPERSRTQKSVAVSATAVVTGTVLLFPILFGPLSENWQGAVVAVSDRVVQVEESSMDEPSSPEPSGTAVARMNSYRQLIEWQFGDPSRLFFGVGFGTGYMMESGALEKLLGSAARDRAMEGIGPHNFLLFVAATMGLTGTLIFITVLAFGFMGAVRAFRRGVGIIYPLAFGVFAGVLTASLFGVVFEAPHGAIPLAWAWGIIFTGNYRTSDAEIPANNRRARRT